MGHPSQQILRLLKIDTSSKGDGISVHCPVCPLAKQTRLAFPISATRASMMFDVVHMDLWGPYKTPTLDRKHYFLTIVDDYSRFLWVHLLQLKSKTIVAIKIFLSMIKTQFNSHVKVVRSDNGTEFLNSQCGDLFNHLGILHQSSCPHTPQQNGVV